MQFSIAALLNANKLPQTPDTQGTLDKIFSIVFVTIGALAVLMIVIAGVRYIAAQGDPNKMAEAKNMILYSLIGLVITALAAALVNFVLGKA